MGVKPAHRSIPRVLCLTALVGLPCGCGREQGDIVWSRGERRVAPGVIVRTIPRGGIAGESDAAVIEVDLSAAQVQCRVAAEDVRIEQGRVYGAARTVREWCRRQNAVAGINGGFFGLTSGGRKEIIGLLARNERVESSGKLVRSPRDPRRRFVRAVLGFDRSGMPHIGWAVGQRGRAAMLTEYLQPLNPVRQQFWTVDSAVACGPLLIRNGRIGVTDREERLASPPPLRRTFAAYSINAGRPKRLVLGIGESMTFADAASFLDRYFRERFGTPPEAAMCLDGGASSQLSFRKDGDIADVRPTGVSVPTAILVIPKR